MTEQHEANRSRLDRHRTRRGPSTAPRITLIIVNFNGERFLPELLEGLAAQSRRDFATLLVDNGSTDGGIALVRSAYPWVEVDETGRNLGFARAANRGVRLVTTPYVGLLNPDIRPEPDWLDWPAAVLEGDPTVAAVAPKMRLADRPNVLNGVGGCMNRLGYTWDRGMGEEDRGQYDSPAEVFFAPAAASLFRREAFLAAGGFDERFFMYHEDVDLAWTLWLFGYRVVTEPRAVVYHHFGGTTREQRSLSWREILGERNNIRALLKHYEPSNLARALTALVLLPQSPRRKLLQMRNFLWNLVLLPETLKRRRFVQRRRVRSDAELAYLVEARDDVPVRL